MTEFLGMCGVLVISAASLLILSEREKQLSSLISSLIYVIAFAYVITKATALWNKASSVFENLSVNFSGKYIMQISGIAILATVCATVCEEVGQKTVARILETAAVIEILYISLPACIDLLEKLFLIIGE